MKSFQFNGEESARFTRFAKSCIEAEVEAHVEVLGRDPLTSRPVSINGIVTDAKLDRYIRYIVVKETNSEIDYWIAGSNSTRSIASRSVIFSLDPKHVETLKQYGNSAPLHVPRIRRHRDREDDLLWTIEKSVEELSDENLDLLLNSITHDDSRVALEAALTLRAFSDFIRERTDRQSKTEARILGSLSRIENEATQCALAENLGYFGKSDSVGALAIILKNDDTKDHVRWAAAVALGRLPGVDVGKHLVPSLTSSSCSHEWTKVALVLAIARNAAESDRTILETLYRDLLSADNTGIVIRYACLGLSRFETHENETAELLIAVLGDDQIGIDVRGYSAMAVASALPSYSEARVSHLKRILGLFSRQNPIDMADPEAVWGVEFLAELASILEQNEVSASLNGLLAKYFDDWRTGYYTCMKYYEQGESAVRRNGGDDAIIEYEKALTALKPHRTVDAVQGLPPEAVATMQFRNDIVQSRQKLQMIIRDWMDAVRPIDLEGLAEQITPVYQGYRRYAMAANIGPDRQLVDREISYIRNTSYLVAVIQMLIRFDHKLQTAQVTDAAVMDIQADLANIIEQLKKLEDRFKSGFAQSLHELVTILLADLGGFESSMKKPDISSLDVLRLGRSAISGVRGAFWCASWPMPGRACPVYGLGRAKLTIKTEDLFGKGTEKEPFIFPDNAPIVIPVSVHIFEMAPGGVTTLHLNYSMAQKKHSIGIPIVEDQYTCTVHLDEKLSPYAPLRLDINLEFRARDCTQKADEKAIYVKGKVNGEA
jgi:hypothetical protein